MARDFSWPDSASRYLQVYQRAIDTALGRARRSEAVLKFLYLPGRQ
mgnify:CR=1 FL=1